MNMFEMYVNEIAMESEGYDKLKKLKKNAKTDISELFDEADKLFKEGKFKESQKLLTQMKQEYTNLYNQVKAIDTTKMDDIRSKANTIVRSFLGSILPASLYFVAAEVNHVRYANKTSKEMSKEISPDKVKIKSVNPTHVKDNVKEAAGFAGLVFIAQLAARVAVHKMDWKEDLPKDDKTGNTLKNNLLADINFSIKLVDITYRVTVRAETMFKQFKKENPNASFSEVLQKAIDKANKEISKEG